MAGEAVPGLQRGGEVGEKARQGAPRRRRLQPAGPYAVVVGAGSTGRVAKDALGGRQQGDGLLVGGREALRNRRGIGRVLGVSVRELRLTQRQQDRRIARRQACRPFGVEQRARARPRGRPGPRRRAAGRRRVSACLPETRTRQPDRRRTPAAWLSAAAARSARRPPRRRRAPPRPRRRPGCAARPAGRGRGGRRCRRLAVAGRPGRRPQPPRGGLAPPAPCRAPARSPARRGPPSAPRAAPSQPRWPGRRQAGARRGCAAPRRGRARGPGERGRLRRLRSASPPAPAAAPARTGTAPWPAPARSRGGASPRPAPDRPAGRRRGPAGRRGPAAPAAQQSGARSPGGPAPRGHR